MNHLLAAEGSATAKEFEQSRQPGRRRRRIASGVAGLLAVLIAAAPVAAMATVSQYGAVGPLLNNYSSFVQCTNRSLRSSGDNIGRTPSYPASNQTIQMWPILEWSSNNSSWYVKERRNPISVLTRPGQMAVFGAQEFTLRPGYYFRITMVFRWYAGGVLVGEVVDRFTDLDMTTGAGAYRTSVGGWASCYIPY